jgi:hypothetical protein
MVLLKEKKQLSDRIEFEIKESSIRFRVKKEIRTMVFLLIVAVPLFYIIFYSYWIIILLGVYACIEWFGFAEFIFDHKSGLIRKRFGIGRFKLGDSLRLPLSNSIIRVTSSYSDFEIPIIDYYTIEINSGNAKMEFYSSKQVELIENLLEKLSATGVVIQAKELYEQEIG